jgi:hypothetical protein
MAYALQFGHMQWKDRTINTSILTAKGQTTVPAKIRAKINVGPKRKI